jgi:pre-rRNA-processing protein TSR1
MDIEPVLLVEPDPSSADSLVSSNDPDDLANEQTWPTEEEMNGLTDDIQPKIPDAVNGTTPKTVRRIPKGMSEYQAAWIIDEEYEDEGEEDSEKKGTGDEVEMEMDVTQEEEEMEDMPVDYALSDSDKRGVHFEDLDVEEEERQ